MFDDDRCTSLVFNLSQSVSLLLLDSYKVGLNKREHVGKVVSPAAAAADDDYNNSTLVLKSECF